MTPAETLLHVTLNPGHSIASPRSAVGQDAMATLAPLLPNGGQPPGPFSAFHVQIVNEAAGGAVFTVTRAREPIVTGGVVWRPEAEAAVWSGLEGLYFQLNESLPALYPHGAEARKPGSLPWLAVVTLPSLLNQARSDVGWLGDFERCLAWALIQAASPPS